MANTIKNKVAKFKEQRNYKKKLYTWFTVLALVIALSTLWVLVQPANTISGQLICGLEEHTHTEECYERQLICDQEEGEEHTHNEECWEKVLVCSTPEHTHIAECYDVKKLKDDSEVESEEEEQEQEQENASAAQPEQEQPQQNSEVTEETVQGEADQMPAIPSQLLEQLRKGVPTDYTDVRTVQFPKGGAVYLFSQPDVIPKQVELKSELLNETSDTFLQAEKRIKDAGVTYEYLKALDISLVDETGAEVEPTAPVYVSIDYGAFLPEEADPKSIQIQHHKEILPSGDDELMQNGTDYKYENPEIILESVMDEEKGILRQMEDTQSHIATFSTDSFSTYTITSEGWPELKIKIQCVDEFGHELYEKDKPNDIKWGKGYTPSESFTKFFMSDNYDSIPGYQYDGRAYFMRDGEYERQIYGIRRENNSWYYYTKDKDKSTKEKFSTQPNFTINGEKDPPDFIRLIYRKVTDIDVKYMDDAGVFGTTEIPLNAADSPNGTNPDVIKYVGTELEIGNVDVMPKSQTYFFRGKAYVGEPKYENQVVKVIRYDRKPYGVTLEGKELLISKEEPLKLLYRKIQTEKLERTETVPLREKGLKINLFNYNTSINNGHKLQFRPQGTSEQPYNSWTGKDGGIYEGIVGKTLNKEGYPTVNGESLDYLFDPIRCRQQLSTGQVKAVHTDLDHLFWQDMDGYYHYNSMTNFATVIPENSTESKNDSNGGNFLVYKQPVLPGYNGTGDNAKFLPFDTYANANRLKPENQSAGKEYHFGMTMEAPFTIPPGGKVPDADGGHTGLRDMIFEFNGDDDVWIFIDDKLVLDLGGIHDRYGGMINFRTGEVVTNAPPTPHSGRYQKNLYGIKEDPNKMTDEQLKEAREKVGFGKFSHHTFKFFYLERGEGASNCEIRFNLVPVQHGLIVGKRLPEESMKDVATEHMWYQFQAETEFDGIRKPLSNATFQRIQWKPGVDPITGGHVLEAGKTDEKGRFWLRAGERADLAGAIDLKATGVTDEKKIKIYVSEILPDGKPVPKVTAWDGKEEKPGSYYEVTDPTGKKRKLVPPLYDDQVNYHKNGNRTDIAQVKLDTSELAYQAKLDTGMKNEFNWIDFENDVGKLAGLNITKYAKHSDGKPIDDVPFAIKVELWDTKDKKWIPLPEGTDYWILDNRVVQPGEKLPEEDRHQLEKADEGLISIKNNQSIHMHVLPDTKYRVSEILTLEDKVVYTTTYKGKSSIEGENNWKDFSDETGNGIESTVGIQADSQHYVTINNIGDPVITPRGSFVLMKKTEGVIPTNTNFQFYLDIQDYTNEQGELSCTAVYYGSPAGARAQGHEETIVFKPESGGGTYRANLNLHPGEIVVIQGLPEGKALQVQEIFEEAQDGYYDVSFQEEGKDEIVNGKSIITSPINGQSVVKVNCVNRSNLKDNSALSISKEVKRTDQSDGAPLPEDLEKQFIFQVTIKNPGTVSLENVPVKKTLTNGQISYFRLKFEPQGDDYVAKVELKHKEEVTISGLPVGVQVVVQELDHDGYAVSMNGTPGDLITVDLGFNIGTPYVVKCVNMAGVRLPETGGHGIMPYFLFGAVMMLSAVGMFLLSSRRKREN